MTERIYAAPGMLWTPQAKFTRPADTNAYSIGDLVANSTTAASVVAMQFDVGPCTGIGKIPRARVYTSNTALTNAQFRLHLYASAPTAANGDNGAWSTTTSGWYGSLSNAAALKYAFSDGAGDVMAADVLPAVEFNQSNSGNTVPVLYGLLQVLAAYTPTSAEIFTLTLEIAQI